MPLDEPRPRHPLPHGHVPDEVRRAAEDLAPGSGGAPWRRLRGGRTSRVWRVERAAGAVVVKLCDGPSTPLFPNDPAAELGALRRLRGTGLAPRPLGGASTRLGAVLAYEHVPSEGPAEPEAAARALARLHALPPPPGARRPPPLRARLEGLLAALVAPPPALVSAARGPEPEAARGPEPEAVQGLERAAVARAFLHGDPTPGNALAAGGGCVLIDWQCPAAGDPCEDLAILLSPAMRRLEGLAPLCPARERAVLAAYGSPALAGRLAGSRRMRRALLAAHCLWRAERGWPGAREAAAAELEAMA